MAVYVMILIQVVAFQMSTGNVAFFYFAETCEDAGMGFALSAVQGSNIPMAFSVSYLIDSALKFEGTFWFYSALNVLCVLFLIV
jgi:hypothetical protein